VDDCRKGDYQETPTMIDPSADSSIDPATPLFRVRNFRILFTTRLASNAAHQMQSVVVAWQVYEITDSALMLGMIGLVQFMPTLLLLLLSGQVADRYDRRLILRWSLAVQICVTISLLTITALPIPPVGVILAILTVNSIARTFEGPAQQSLLPGMIPRAILPRAIAAQSSTVRLSQLIGPAVGGLLYDFGASIDYGICMSLIVVAAAGSFVMPKPPTPEAKERPNWTAVLSGLTFIWRCKPVLGSMLLDLVVSLFGGVTALLPIFARDILEVGPWGFGLLRSSAATGGLLVAFILARHPITRKGGIKALTGMGFLGLAIVGFGLSEYTPLSIALLMCAGIGDMMSTVVRQTLIQVNTPNEMLGRVYAVNTLFVGTGGQLGAFESGVLAEFFGAVNAVLIGGGAVLLTVILWVWLFPGLRRVNRPDEVQPA
jgi:MFS family permease